VCNKKYEMPKEGLIINNSLLKILSIMPTDVSGGESYDFLEKLLDEMQKKTSFIKLGIENSCDLVNKYTNIRTVNSFLK